MRRDKTNYYLDIAEVVAQRATCLRRRYGAVIVKNDEVVASGYNGAPRGRKNCSDLGRCLRQEQNIKSGERYELCRSVHAEANACLSAGRKNCIGATIYLTGLEGDKYAKAECCIMCKRYLINSGIESVFYRIDKDNYEEVRISDWIENDEGMEMLEKV